MRGGATPPAGMAPVRAFFLLGIVATAVAGLVMLTRDAAPSEHSPTTRPSPDYSLTDAEAIAEFERLHRMFRTASMHRDQSLVDAMLTVDSPLHTTAQQQIRQLISDGVLDRSRFVEQSVGVVENSGSEVELRQVVVIHPRFVAEATGRSVAEGTSLKQTVRWSLALDGTVWKIHDSEVLSSRRVR